MNLMIFSFFIVLKRKFQFYLKKIRMIMRNKKEAEANNFNTLEDLYAHLEIEATKYKDFYNIDPLFRNLLKKLGEESPESEIIKWEIGFLCIIINENEIRQNIEDFGFSDKTYEYLKSRQSLTKNSLFKAHYSHILWLIKYKNNIYAKDAVDSYLKLLKIYEEYHIKNPEEHYGLNIYNFSANAFLLSLQINYLCSEVKQEILRLINDLENSNVATTSLKIRLIKLIIENRKIFEKTELQPLTEICKKISDYLIDGKHFWEAIDVYKIGQEIDSKIDEKTFNWNKKIAFCYETLMELHENSNEAVAPDYCLKALTYYKKIGDTEKVKYLEPKYTELSNKVHYGEITTEIDLSEHLKYWNEVADNFVELDPSDIIKHLAMDNELFPSKEELDGLIEDERKHAPLHYILQKSVIDTNGHVSQHFTEPEELEYHCRLENYYYLLKHYKLPLINKIIFKSVQEKKLTLELFISFMEANSWLGKPFLKHYPNNKVKQVKWLDYIIPGIKEYFNEIEKVIADKSYKPSLITCMDSLCIKLEGIIRDICALSNIPTFSISRDNKGREVTREKDINILLHEKDLQDKFTKDEMLFLKFLLIEKAGLNLRNLIAHSLFSLESYDLAYAHLLFIAILKLGAFIIK
jgi:hypothetical protein